MDDSCGRREKYTAYMLRLWQVGSRSGQPVWRASLENPHTGERQAFGDVEALVAFLADKLGVPPAARAPLETDERSDC